MPDFVIGKIVNTHGIKGEIRVFPVTDDPTRFELLESVTVRRGESSRDYLIEGVRYQKRVLLVKLRGIDNMSAAEKLKGSEITIPEELALPLGENEYYARDLIGLAVIYEDGTRLGEISEILASGSNDIYAVKRENGKDILVPAVKQFILNVNLTDKTVTVRLPEGLIE